MTDTRPDARERAALAIARNQHAGFDSMNSTARNGALSAAESDVESLTAAGLAVVDAGVLTELVEAAAKYLDPTPDNYKLLAQAVAALADQTGVGDG